MNKTIRVLHSEDFPYVDAMDTGIEDDYVKRIFDRLTTGNHRLFGVFMDDQLACMAGYTIFANRYAMLGRIRSDINFRGKDLATELSAYIMKEAFKLSNIQWVGANTQKHNKPARRVLEKLDLTNYVQLHGAITSDVSQFETGTEPWREVQSIEEKKSWAEEAFIKRSRIFPYECYYPFPASEALFNEENLEKWSFFENKEQTRVLITKYDQKKHHYLHTVYPWDDFLSQSGLWETVTNEYRKLVEKTDEETYIWKDFTKEEAQLLPEDHPFELPSPWFLYGINKETYNKRSQKIEETQR
ncbi:GNAT family N-acetyltransferase [Bacillus shivajii]|uniref:GNAT family N-acetyltransferase n=1 Tax=Bacillus shivajii TaxID=1983719 RepID=UPI001CFA1B87|nr:GNAT family N-acetyltransferase [Bacillus shivajii]UCZ54887.1 GNAT family N-acetyltransferase [Bacillus shivajii]